MDDTVSGEIYNVGSTNRISVNALADRVIELTGSSSTTVSVPYGEVYGHGIEDMLHRIPSTAKIKAAIGWEPERSLEDILNDVISFERGRSEAVAQGPSRAT